MKRPALIGVRDLNRKPIDSGSPSSPVAQLEWNQMLNLDQYQPAPKTPVIVFETPSLAIV